MSDFSFSDSDFESEGAFEKPTKKRRLEKPAKKSLSAAHQKVLTYLREQNRPYSALNIFDNLHEEVKKSFLLRILEDLKDEGIVCKEYGKFKVYYPDQSELNAQFDQSAVSSIVDREAEARQTLALLNDRICVLKQEVAALASAPADGELDASLEQARRENVELKERIELLRGPSAKTFDAGEFAKLQKKKLDFQKLWKSRRRAVMEIVSLVADGMNVSLKNAMVLFVDVVCFDDFQEECGIEDDP